MTWNIIINYLIEIKNKYIAQFGAKNLYEKNKLTCVERWIKELNINEYNELAQKIHFTQYDNLILLRYSQVNNILDINFWNEYNGFMKECRSIVIDIKNEKLVITPFKKFFNINENNEVTYDIIDKKIQNARIVEFSNKLDGAMQCARWYDNKMVFTSSMCLNMNNSWALRDGYSMLMSQSNYIDMIKDNKHITFIFEYISLKDAHIVIYTKEQEGLYLIGMRNVNTGEEFTYTDVLRIAKKYNVKTTQIYNNVTLKDIIENLDKKHSYESEGFVLNIDGLKVKIKYNDFVFMHKTLPTLVSSELMIKSIADNTFDDFISKIPEKYRELVIKKSNNVFNYIHKMEKIVNHYYNICYDENIKTFVMNVNNIVPEFLQFYMYNRYKGKENNYIKTHLRYKNIKEINNMLHKINELEGKQE